LAHIDDDFPPWAIVAIKGFAGRAKTRTETKLAELKEENEDLEAWINKCDEAQIEVADDANDSDDPPSPPVPSNTIIHAYQQSQGS
jgi:hypothetical protein